MTVADKQKYLDRISSVEEVLFDILAGKKPYLEGDNIFLKGQLNEAFKFGALPEPEYKYLRGSREDKTSEKFITKEWSTSAFTHRNLKSFFKGLKRELGKDINGGNNYSNYAVVTPHQIVEAGSAEIDYSDKSAIFIPSGGIKSMLLYLDVIEKKLNGELDLPVFIHDINQPFKTYFSGINSAIGITGSLESLGLNNIISSNNIDQLVKKFKVFHKNNEIKKSNRINYKEDFYAILQEKQPVFVLNTGNSEKIEELKRCLQYFGVSTHVYKADDVFGAINSPEEKSESFAGNNAEKRAPMIEALESEEGKRKFESFLARNNFSKEQIFFGAHDGGLALDERIYKHEGFSRIAELCKQAGLNLDSVNTKQMVEFAGSVYNLFSIVNNIAHKEGNPELLRVWEMDNFSFFNAANPRNTYNYNARKENIITIPDNLQNVDPLKSSYFMRPTNSNITQAEGGRKSHIGEYSLEEDKFLANETGFGDIVWALVNCLNFKFNKELSQEYKTEKLTVTILGETADQKAFLKKSFLKELLKDPRIDLDQRNADKNLREKPDITTDFQEDILRYNDAFILLPVKKLTGKETFTEEERMKNLENLAKNLFSISALYVDMKDLQTPFGAKKLVIKYMPQGLEDTHSFDYVEKIFLANSNNFGGKGNPNQFWVEAKTADEISSLVKRHCKSYKRAELPEKRSYEIPGIGSLNTPCVTVFGSSSTENPELRQASRDLYAGLLERGISISYGGMVRGIGKGLVGNMETDNMVGILNDEVFLKRMERLISSGKINRPSIVGVYTNESKDIEGALFAEDFPQASKAVNITAIKSENIYHRMDIMDDVAEKNKMAPDFGSVSIVMPGSNGTLEELAKNLVESFKNPGSRKIVIWNYKNDFGGNEKNVGYYDQVLKTIRETAGLKTNKELEKFGIYVEESAKGVLSKIDTFALKANRQDPANKNNKTFKSANYR